MSKYGIPYMGSKNQIAEEIIDFLPSGNRFIDLFGGGFAMSHCAILSGKYKKVFYNELNPLLEPLIRDAINGKYSYEKFKPKFITREEFFEKKEQDGYIKYIWSFGNRGDTYLYGKDIEKQKEILHNLIVFNDYTKVNEIIPEFEKLYKGDIKNRRKELKTRIENLERINNLQNLQQLERLARLQQLELHTGCYKDYEYQEGDVVYCDPPYEYTAKYNEEEFNHKEFYDWVATRDYQVFFSSYEISDKRFHIVWKKDKRSLFASSGSLYNTEYIYSNRPYVKQAVQLDLLDIC